MGADFGCTQIGTHFALEQDHPVPEVDQRCQGGPQNIQNDAIFDNLLALLFLHVVADCEQDADVDLAARRELHGESLQNLSERHHAAVYGITALDRPHTPRLRHRTARQPAIDRRCLWHFHGSHY